jgi:putative ATPase
VLQGRVFYQPSDQGYEGTIAREIARRRELQIEAAVAEPPPEILSYSPATDRRLETWIRRASEERQRSAGEMRDRVSSMLAPSRSDRILLAGATASLHLWEAVRAAPEGRVVALLPAGPRLETARHYAESLPDIERPLVLELDPDVWSGAVEAAPDHPFDRLLLADAMGTAEDQERVLGAFRQTSQAGETSAISVTPESIAVIVQRVPRRSQRLSELWRDAGGTSAELLAALEAAEERLVNEATHPRLSWDADDLLAAAAAAGLEVESDELVPAEEMRYLEARHITGWLAPDRAGGLGAMVRKMGGEAVRSRLEEELNRKLANETVRWRSADLVVRARMRPA